MLSTLKVLSSICSTKKKKEGSGKGCEAVSAEGPFADSRRATYTVTHQRSAGVKRPMNISHKKRNKELGRTTQGL